jgi:3-methylfumaryl-CoA hydratase
MLEQSIIKSKEICNLTMVRRVAAMLDLPTSTFSEGDILPKGWHFFMLAGETRKSDLRQDGFPGLGVVIPDLGLPRLLLGSRTVTYHADIIIGSVLEKSSFIKSIVEKESSSGPMAIVCIQHELRPFSESKPAVIETQTYVLKSKINHGLATKNESMSNPPMPTSRFITTTPDETLLFQYSALGFNSHKIHLDRDYARNVEGLPDLIVNGGLSTLLMTEFARNELGMNLSEIKVKHLSPLYCNRPLNIVLEEKEIKIYNENNEVCVAMEITELELTKE